MSPLTSLQQSEVKEAVASLWHCCFQEDLNRGVGTRDVPAEVTTAVRNVRGGHWHLSFAAAMSTTYTPHDPVPHQLAACRRT